MHLIVPYIEISHIHHESKQTILIVNPRDAITEFVATVSCIEKELTKKMK